MEIRGLKMQDLWGIKILSTASAFPSLGRFVSNSEIHQMRFGNNWDEVFRSKNYNIDFIAVSYTHLTLPTSDLV